MNNSAFVTGANHGLGLALCAQLLHEGWRVFAGEYPAQSSLLGDLQTRYPETLRIVPLDVSSGESVAMAARAVAAHTRSLDVLINNAAVLGQSEESTIREKPDYDEMPRVYNVNTLGALRVTEALLPLLDAGTLKRLCFLSSEAGSIERAGRRSWFGYCNSKTALNMSTRLLFNDLHPQGYTFRLYYPGWMRTFMRGHKDEEATLEPEEAARFALKEFLEPRANEGELKMVDWQGNEWPW